jgi:hypothetical protein
LLHILLLLLLLDPGSSPLPLDPSEGIQKSSVGSKSLVSRFNSSVGKGRGVDTTGLGIEGLDAVIE